MGIADRIHRVRETMAAAARRAGRAPEEVRLMAVTKRVADGPIREALEAGVEILGENYVQEARRKAETIGKRGEWHLIGSLQTNKAKYAVRLFDMIHALDRTELAVEIDRRAREAGRVMPVLIEVNLAGEASKSGVPTEEAATLIRVAAALPNLAVVGLMTMPPWFADPEASRPYFRALRSLRDRIAAEGIPGAALRELSMGMTDDYPVAIEEGATIVRIGRGIFGERR